MAKALDYTRPAEDPEPDPADQRMFHREVDSRIAGIPSRDHVTSASAGEGTGVDRTAPFVNQPIVIDPLGGGARPGGAVDMGGNPILANTVECPEITANTTLNVNDWARLASGRWLEVNSASAVTITIDATAITGSAQGGDAGIPVGDVGNLYPSITLAASASSEDDAYRHSDITVNNETHTIIASDGTTKKAYIRGPWAQVPVSTDAYTIKAHVQNLTRTATIFTVQRMGAGNVTIAVAGGLTLLTGGAIPELYQTVTVKILGTNVTVI